MVRQESLQYAAIGRRRARRTSWVDQTELLFLLVAAFVTLLVINIGVRASFADTEPRAVRTITVQKGDTLWSLAQKHGDPDQYILIRVSALAEANNIGNGRLLQVGQELVVPSTWGDPAQP